MTYLATYGLPHNKYFQFEAETLNQAKTLATRHNNNFEKPSERITLRFEVEDSGIMFDGKLWYMRAYKKGSKWSTFL